MISKKQVYRLELVNLYQLRSSQRDSATWISTSLGLRKGSTLLSHRESFSRHQMDTSMKLLSWLWLLLLCYLSWYIMIMILMIHHDNPSLSMHMDAFLRITISANGCKWIMMHTMKSIHRRASESVEGHQKSDHLSLPWSVDSGGTLTHHFLAVQTLRTQVYWPVMTPPTCYHTTWQSNMAFCSITHSQWFCQPYSDLHLAGGNSKLVMFDDTQG